MTTLRAHAAALGMIVVSLYLPGGAYAICASEHAPCYRFVRYENGEQCRRYYSGVLRHFGVRGSIGGLTAAEFNAASVGAVHEWTDNTFMSIAMLSAGADTVGANGLNNVIAVIGAAEFDSYWPTANAVTVSVYWPVDGVVRRQRTYVRGDGDQFTWRADCRNVVCGSTDVDLVGTITHEIGHWWMLDDVWTPVSLMGCDSTTMWATTVRNNTFKRTVAYWDIYGINHLYQQATETAFTVRSSSGPVADTLRWEDPRPSIGADFVVGASDTCWGPYGIVDVIAHGDPSHTTDGLNYTYVARDLFARGYAYRVSKSGSVGKAVSQRTSGVPATPPTSPSNLAARVGSVNGSRYVELTWDAAEGVVSGYYVYSHWLHLEDCGIEAMAPWQISGPFTATTYADSFPIIGDSLFYRVRAVNATDGSGLSNEVAVWLPEVLGVPQGMSGAAMVELHPNPTRSGCEVEFRLPRAARVRVAVYDLAGRRVALLLDEAIGPGAHRRRWDARHVKAGTYYLRLFADEESVGGRKLIVLR